MPTRTIRDVDGVPGREDARPGREDARTDWLRVVRAWVDESLARAGIASSGAFETVKDRPWATVMRLSTPRGSVYFKASGPGGVHEPALVATLREALQGRDALQTWERLLPLYAELQLDSARDPSRWLGLSVPDRRLDALPDLLSELLDADATLLMGLPGGLEEGERATMREMLPEFRACCRELGTMPDAAAIEHGDLHDNNVLVGDGCWLFDWGDSSVTHPFISLLVTCNTHVDDSANADGLRRIARLRDAYLEPWTRHAPASSLRELFATALWVGLVSRALDWDHMLRGTPGADLAEWQAHIPRWLRLWVERRRLFTRSR